MRAASLALLLLATPAHAVEPGEVLADPALEARARAISANLRCVVCQNEPIDSSNADMAADMRVLVRERLLAGDTDDEVFGYMTARYGDYVLFKPPFRPSTWALWLGPFALMAAAGGGIALAARRRGGAETAALTDEEREALERL